VFSIYARQPLTLPHVIEPSSSPGAPSVFVLFRDSELRREALRSPVGDASRYSLYGLDELRGAGFAVEHGLEPQFEPTARVRAEASLLDRAVKLAGGYSGDFARVLASASAFNRTDVVFSTVDTVGIPLALLGRLGRVRPPVVYAAIGLPERLAHLRGGVARRLFVDAFGRLDTVVAYGWSEVDELRGWLDGRGPRVEFVAFGVDTTYFHPDPDVAIEHDVVSIGADPRRDFVLLLDVARRQPDRSFLVVASPDNAAALGVVPANVRLEVNVPFHRVRECLLSARVVALPVRENSYSGATTTLLQGMACAKPVVASRTAAIARGYHLEDAVNSRLVAPGDAAEFESALLDLLDRPSQAEELGRRARETVERHLTWADYTSKIGRLLSDAAARRALPA
jgi:glycosyltransferase involved in cell wall biosynthesis